MLQKEHSVVIDSCSIPPHSRSSVRRKVERLSVVKTETYGGIAALSMTVHGVSRSSISRQKNGAGALEWFGATALSAWEINETLSFPRTGVSNVKPAAPQ